MKDITGASVETSGNLAMADAVECSIDASGMGHIMSILSNMYANKSLAVLREYSANAWDSHVEAGNTDTPIEVTLPTTLQPTLLIKDYGTGLSKDQIINVFGSYGTSTKRDTNDQVGALGIGSKAAFTLGQQFVVTGVKDGLKTVVLFSLNANNVGTMKVVHDEIVTDEANGVTISLAVEDVESMRVEAATFFAKWKPGRVLVDGAQPESVFDNAKQINENTHIVDEHSGSVWVVMGQIAYAVDQSLVRKVRDTFDTESTEYVVSNDLASWYQKSAIFFDVEIGDVDIAPSRESLRDTRRTVSTLATRFTELAASLNDSVQTAVDAEPNAFQAVVTLERLRDEMLPLKVQRKAITYLGQALPATQKTNLLFLGLRKKSYRSAQTSTFQEKDFEATVPQAQKTVVVVVSDLEKEMGTVRRYAKRFLSQPLSTEDEWRTEREMKVNNIVVTDQEKGHQGWFVWGEQDAVTTMSLDEYRASVKTLRESTPSNRNVPSYSTGWGSASKDVEDRETIEEILEYGTDVLLIDSNERTSAGAMERELFANHTVVVLLPQQSKSQFIKRITDADPDVKVIEALQRHEMMEAYAKTRYNPTEAEKEALGALVWLAEHRNTVESWKNVSDYYQRLQRFEMAGAEGPVLALPAVMQDVLETAELAELMSQQITRTRKNELDEAAAVLARAGEEYVIPFEVEITSVGKTYPLLKSGGYGAYNDRYQDDEFKHDVLAYIRSKG